MKNILDLIDFNKIETLLEGHYKSTGFVVGILDLEGNILATSSWNKICKDFHRANQNSCKRCIESDIELGSKKISGNKYDSYKCLNGLVDVVAPVIIGNTHVANLYCGQFVYEKPDRNFFIKQAEKFGFDKEKYLGVLKQVPIVSKEKVKDVMAFLTNLIQHISEMAMQKVEQENLLTKIKENEAKYIDLYENSPVMMVNVDHKTGKILDCNATLCKKTGYSKQEIIGKHVLERYYSKKEAEITFNEFLKTGIIKSAELKLKKKHGGYIDVLLKVTTVKDQNGNLLYSRSVWQDITEQKNAKITLEKNEARLKEAQSIAKVGNFNHDFKKDTLWWSDETFKILGFDKTDIPPNYATFIKRLPDEDKEKLNALVDKAEKYGEDYSTTYRYQIPGADLKYIYVKAQVEYNNEGKPKGLIGTVQNITERKKAEEELKQSEKRLNEAQELAHIGSWEYTIDPDTVVWSKELFNIFELSSNLPAPKYSEQPPFYTEESFAKLDRAVQECVQHGIPYEIELDIITSSGSIKQIISIGTAKKDSNNKIIGCYGIAQDITEKKKAEQEIHYHASLIKQVDSAIITINFENKILSWNEHAEILYQWKKEEALGKNIIELLAPEELKDETFKNFEDLNKDGHWEGDYDVKRKDGTTIPVHIVNTYLKDHEGKNIGFIGVSTDITLRKKTEQILRESEAFKETLLNITPDIIYIYDLIEKKNLYSNDGIIKILSYDIEEIQQMGDKIIPMLMHPDDFKTYVNETVPKYQKLKDNELLEHVYRMKHKNGGWHWLESRESIYERSESGVPAKIFGIITDITERRIAEQALVQSEEKFREIYEQSPVAIQYYDKDGNLIDVNKKTLELFGINSSDEIAPYNFWQDSKLSEQNEKDLRNGIQVSLSDTLDFDEVKKHKLFKTKKSGFIDVEMLVAPILDQNNTIGYLVHLFDVTVRKKAEEQIINQNAEYEALNEELRQTNEELYIAKRKAEESDRLKSAFLANMSHEIRTPLNGIKGFINLLEKPELSEEKRKHYTQVIHKSSDRLITTINNIIDISKIEAGQVQITNEVLNLNELLREIEEFFEPQAKSLGLNFNFNYPLSDDDSFIITDNELLYGIITNLVKNAIKFTEEGSISVGYRINKSLGSYVLEVYVKDTGVGIPKDKLDLIFKRFVKADIEEKNAIQGSGLGLAICKAYVDFLSGEIYVESQEGKGSTFRFSIKCSKPNKTKDKLSSDNSFELPANLKILIVEDDLVSYDLLENLFSEYDVKILHALNGKEAIEIYNANPDIDVILMDMELPIMDGYQATREIRKLSPNTIIIAQTAFAMEGDSEKSIKAGCNDHLTKPIDEDVLIKTIIKHLSK